MKKNYVTPLMTRETFKGDYLILGPGGGQGAVISNPNGQLVKDRDDELDDNGNPIWGDDGKLW